MRMRPQAKRQGALAVMAVLSAVSLSAQSAATQPPAARQASAATQTPIAIELSAADAIRAAVLERMGRGGELTTTPLSVPADPKLLKSATPDPSALRGKPLRFSLLASSGRTVAATADVHVVAE